MAAIITPENATAADVDAITDTPETAADAQLTPAPGTEPDTALSARDGAVWAALTANPGSSATMIGAAAGMSRVTVGKILNSFEAEGRATRVPGGHDGRSRTPDRWHPATPGTPILADTEPDVVPVPDGDAPADAEPPAVPVTLPDGDGSTDSASDVPADVPDGDAPAGISDGDRPDTSDDAPADVPMGDVCGPEGTDAGLADLTGPDGDASADITPAPESVTGPEIASEAMAPDEETGQDSPDVPADAPGDESDGRDVCEETTEPEDPAWVRARAELLELADLIIGTVTAADGDGDAVTALGRLEMAMAKAPQAHRNARAVLTGTAPTRATTGRTNGSGNGTGGARTGQLRERVLSHLIDHPGKDFTPYEIGRVLDSSSGAVANALDRLVNLGQAELTCERPRRYALAVNPAPGD